MSTPTKGKMAPRVVVELTREMIDLAVPRDSGHCMIADAIQAAVPHAKFISVDLQSIRFSDPATRQRYTFLTPRKVQEALLKFDQGVKSDPFNFQLRAGLVTPMNNRSGGQAQLRRGRTNRALPTRVGGKTPPVGPLATGAGTGSQIPTARRRQFGLRAFDR